jgi:hypothetical protein
MLETYVYSHCNMCNIPIYFYNIKIKQRHREKTAQRASGCADGTSELGHWTSGAYESERRKALVCPYVLIVSYRIVIHIVRLDNNQS